MRFESTVEVFRLLLDVFDYLARAEFLPEYAADFVWVNETSGQGPRLGAEYAYRMKPARKALSDAWLTSPTQDRRGKVLRRRLVLGQWRLHVAGS